MCGYGVVFLLMCIVLYCAIMLSFLSSCNSINVTVDITLIQWPLRQVISTLAPNHALSASITPSLLFNLYSINPPFPNSYDLSSSAISTNPLIHNPLQSQSKTNIPARIDLYVNLYTGTGYGYDPVRGIVDSGCPCTCISK